MVVLVALYTDYSVDGCSDRFCYALVGGLGESVSYLSTTIEMIAKPP